MRQKKQRKQNRKHSYTNQFHETQHDFEPNNDEMIVTFNTQLTQEAAESLSESASLTIINRNLKSRYAHLQVLPGIDAEAAAAFLEAHADVANVIPAMMDDKGQSHYFIPDECTVQFNEDVSVEDAERIIAEIGSEIVVNQRTPGYYTIAVPEDKDLFETIQKLLEFDEVHFAEPSELAVNDAYAYIPNDPDFGQQWALQNTGKMIDGQHQGTAGVDINVTKAWEISKGNPDVIAVILDTGIDMDHPDLAANILPRGDEDWDFGDVDDDIPEDSQKAGFHGTHVAGIVGAVENTTGVIGVAPQCKLMPLRHSSKMADRGDAINYVAKQAVANPDKRYVLNCSWGHTKNHIALHKAIINAVNKNVIVVTAAGNKSRDIDKTPAYPGGYPEVINVAAINARNAKFPKSNYGSSVDVCAPGTFIYSTVGNGGYDFKHGTSMAAPHVTGLAALIWSVAPHLKNSEVREIIESTCDDVYADNLGFTGKLGKGRINAYAALKKAQAKKPEPPEPVSTYKPGQLKQHKILTTNTKIQLNSWAYKYEGMTALPLKKGYIYAIFITYPYGEHGRGSGWNSIKVPKGVTFRKEDEPGNMMNGDMYYVNAEKMASKQADCRILAGGFVNYLTIVQYVEVHHSAVPTLTEPHTYTVPPSKDGAFLDIIKVTERKSDINLATENGAGRFVVQLATDHEEFWSREDSKESIDTGIWGMAVSQYESDEVQESSAKIWVD